jgi:hypothetical protein
MSILITSAVPDGSASDQGAAIMAIELQVTSVTALVTGEPREKNVYQGKGDDRKVVGRFTDSDGRPMSTVPAVVVAAPLGLLGDASVVIPDMQAANLALGTVVRVEGITTARLAGGDFAAIRATVTGERITPVGQFQAWVAQGGPVKASDAKAA